MSHRFHRKSGCVQTAIPLAFSLALSPTSLIVRKKLGLMSVRPGMISRGRAAGHVEVDLGVGQSGGLERLHDALADHADVDAGDADGRHARGEPLQMLVQGENLAVIAAKDLIDAVAEIEPAIAVNRVQALHRDEFVTNHGQFHAKHSLKEIHPLRGTARKSCKDTKIL